MMKAINSPKEELFNKILSRGFWEDIPKRKEKVAQFINVLFNYLFPIQCSCMPDKQQLEQEHLIVYRLFRELYNPIQKMSSVREKYVENRFFSSLPPIYDLLIEDADTIFKGDPAAASIEEVIHIYPGFYAIFIYRIAHILHQLNISLLPRMFSEYSHSITGIDIHPGATIGHSFGIDHGTGIVIGETAIIGNNVKIYQGVTLGAKSVEKKMAQTKRHPTIEDNVTIYARATILGGDTVIGKDSIVGGNVFITHSIPPRSMVHYNNKLSIRTIYSK